MFQSNTATFITETVLVLQKIFYMFLPVRPSSGEAVTKIYKGMQINIERGHLRASF
jgi:hypothetical protein